MRAMQEIQIAADDDAGAEPSTVLSLSEFPDNVLERVATCLYDERDLANLCRASRNCRAVITESNTHLWTRLLEQRFGPDRVPQDPANSRAAYLQSTRLEQPVVNCDCVAWLRDTRYFAVTTARGSRSPEVAVLKLVCWLAMHHTFTGVLPARYQLACRLKAAGRLTWNWLKFKCMPEEGRGQAVEATVSFEEGRGQDHWVTVRGPVFEVTAGAQGSAPCASVFTEVKNTESYWKEGVAFDCIRLERVGGVVQERADLGDNHADAVRPLQSRPQSRTARFIGWYGYLRSLKYPDHF